MYKDIRKIGGQLLIDDDPAEIQFVTKLGCKGFLIKPYRKNSKASMADYQAEYDTITRIIHNTKKISSLCL